MPCNTVTTQSVALAKAIPSLVEEAMKSLGWKIIERKDASLTATHERSKVGWIQGKGVYAWGDVSVAQNQEEIKKLTKAYSKAAVTWAAQRAGWTVKQTGPDTLEVIRR